jgi:hypothetical protein
MSVTSFGPSFASGQSSRLLSSSLVGSRTKAIVAKPRHLTNSHDGMLLLGLLVEENDPCTVVVGRAADLDGLVAPCYILARNSDTNHKFCSYDEI